jgi:hypothetical protein
MSELTGFNSGESGDCEWRLLAKSLASLRPAVGCKINEHPPRPTPAESR